jgi:hypothetical protein
LAPTPPDSPVGAPVLARGAAAALPETIDEEVATLRDARSALRQGHAALAVTLLDEAARRYPDGVLAEDRAAERVFALCASGRVGEARAQAALFLASHARSPYAGAVRSSCGAR